MCGIAGMTGPTASPEQLDRLLEGLVHRGPDDSGTATVGPFHLGLRRLSIIDVAGGHQPFSSDDGTIAVVGNGEIYNHRELRDELEHAGHKFRSGSDIEVVLHLYEEHGDACLDRLRGMFALAVADARTELLLLARDRLGIKPLYYAAGSGGHLAFASEYRGLLALPWVASDPDVEALREFAAWGWIAPPRTAVAGVRKLGPGQLLVAGGSGVQVRDWWQRSFPPAGDGHPLDPEGLLSELDAAVAAHLMSEVPLGVFLSGGLDSSIVAALARRHVDRLAAFTVHFAGDADTADREAARAVARHLDLDHRELVVDPAPLGVLTAVARHHDDPVGDVACIPTYLMAESASEHVTVVLTGEGGDEAFAGYRKYDHLRMARAVTSLPAPIRSLTGAAAARLAGARRGPKLRAWLDAPPALAPLRYDEVFTAAERRDLFADGCDEVTEPVAPADLGTLDAALWVDAGWPLSEQLEMKLDKMTMAHSLEARVPFLDHVLFEAAAWLPEGAKRHKQALKQVARTLLPADVVDRTKHGFAVPVGTWLRHDLRPLMEDLLAPDRLQSQGLWQADSVNGWVRQHLDGTVDRSRQLWNLLAVQLWWEEVAA